MRKMIISRFYHDFPFCLCLRLFSFEPMESFLSSYYMPALHFIPPPIVSDFLALLYMYKLFCVFCTVCCASFSCESHHLALWTVAVIYWWHIVNENIGPEYLSGPYTSNIVLSFLKMIFLVKSYNIGTCEGFIIFTVSIPWP